MMNPVHNVSILIFAALSAWTHSKLSTDENKRLFHPNQSSLSTCGNSNPFTKEASVYVLTHINAVFPFPIPDNMMCTLLLPPT